MNLDLPFPILDRSEWWLWHLSKRFEQKRLRLSIVTLSLCLGAWRMPCRQIVRRYQKHLRFPGRLRVSTLDSDWNGPFFALEPSAWILSVAAAVCISFPSLPSRPFQNSLIWLSTTSLVVSTLWTRVVEHVILKSRAAYQRKVQGVESQSSGVEVPKTFFIFWWANTY